MTKIITVIIEVYDGTTEEQIEDIIGTALDDNGIDCTYEVGKSEG